MEPGLDMIAQFLGLKRIAVVGLSREGKDFTRALFRDLLARGYDAVPVNPAATEIEGHRCYPRVQDVLPPVEGALLLTPPEATEQLVRDCDEAGVRHLWMHRGAGRGAVSPAAVRLARSRGLTVVAGACPYMFLPQAGFVHRAHGWFSRRGAVRRACAQADAPSQSPPGEASNHS
jgi:predicted CoA-binding protein